MFDHRFLTSELKKYFGFDTFKGNQEQIILNLLNENDTFVLMPTGGGKSLCYQLPAMLMDGTAIVISPLIALMKNQVDAMRNYSETDGIAHFFNSSLNKQAIDQVKEDLLSGKTKLLYVAPESLTKQENVALLKKIKISFYAVDEAHCISEWGHDFRREYRNIRPIINEIGVRPIIALTATATPKVQHDIQKNLGITNATVFKSSFNRPNLYYEVRPKTKDVDKEIIKYIQNNHGKSGIVYCLSRKKVEELANLLQLNNIKALPYHAGMDSAARSANQDAFLYEKVDVIVATIAFGMGIDKPDVRYVIHYDIPKSLEGYYQETGRAGRDGGEGNCITFYSHKALDKLRKFTQGKPLAEQEIGKQLLIETAAYAESSVCRRKSLLHYFGEEYDKDNCGNCDNCRHPLQKIDATEQLCDLIDAILTLKEKFKSSYIVDVLLGHEKPEVLSFKHNKLDIFGCLNDKDEAFLNALIQQAIIGGFVRKDIENYGVLHITKAGHDFVDKPTKFMMVGARDFSDSDYDCMESGTAALDSELYGILKSLREDIAQQHNLPPYIIFQDQSLEAMATNYPVDLKELQLIPGVGVGKAKRYGKDFVEVIKKYVTDNDIERPVDLRVRTEPNRSQFKISIIQCIDRQVSLDAIAESSDMEFDELLDVIEAIVNSGNKIDIRYYVEDVVDEDHIDALYDYFRSSTTDDLATAQKEMGSDYTETEIRLVRIMFVSEMGN